MRKRRKSKQTRNVQVQMQNLAQEQISISAEANYIIQRALNGDTRIVRLGALLLFSTESGDAWLLDVEDGLALCLARLGEKQPFHITETATNFSIEWAANYRIEGERFIVIERAGQVRTIIGYPTREIMRAVR
jgi:hypothetical protein